jgi:hypothetical protein
MQQVLRRVGTLFFGLWFPAFRFGCGFEFPFLFVTVAAGNNGRDDFGFGFFLEPLSVERWI